MKIFTGNVHSGTNRIIYIIPIVNLENLIIIKAKSSFRRFQTKLLCLLWNFCENIPWLHPRDCIWKFRDGRELPLSEKDNFLRNCEKRTTFENHISRKVGYWIRFGTLQCDPDAPTLQCNLFAPWYRYPMNLVIKILQCKYSVFHVSDIIVNTMHCNALLAMSLEQRSARMIYTTWNAMVMIFPNPGFPI